MDGCVELAKLFKDYTKNNDNNIFLGEVISTVPLKIKVNGNDLTSSNIMISDSLTNFSVGQNVVALRYNTRLYIIIARVVKL